MFEHIEREIRDTARGLLERKEIGYFIGWETAQFGSGTAPSFIFEPGDVSKLVFNENCVNMLAKYLLDDRYSECKIGLCVRGCESRAVNRMLKDGQIKRENIYLVGIPCDGIKAEKCEICNHRNPLIYDILLGKPMPERPIEDRFHGVDEFEKKSAKERYDFWASQFSKCIRCYACRNVCPACNCVECYVDQHKTGWQGKRCSVAENQNFGLTRAFHVGDRCIECGECERVCPVGIPLMLLNRKLIKDVNDLFGERENGLDSETISALGTFDKEDHDEFM
ncbi:MAG: 4Fe-4S binding protein [Oscillospiraceae bacterium]